MPNKGIFKNKKLLVLLAIVIAVLFPIVCQEEYVLAVGVKVLIMMIYASALNIINGYSGMFNLGVSAFMCISCYTTAMLAKSFNLPFPIVMVASCLTSMIMGLIMVLPTFKLTGMFFSIVTLGVAETVRVIVLNWNSFTNGPLGINAIPFAHIFGFEFKTSRQFFYLALFFLILVLFCINRIINSRIGTAWKSIRENADAASSLGINVSRYKMWNVICSAFFCGIGGCLFVYYYRYIEPGNFAIDRGHEVLAMVALGGTGTLVGPLTGALIVTVTTQLLRYASEFRMVFYGLLIILVMWFRPQGLVGESNSVIATKRESSRRKKAGKASGGEKA